VGTELPPQLGDAFREYFAPEYVLHPRLGTDGRYENKNSRKYLETVRQRIMEQLRYLGSAPGVQMQEVPPDLLGLQSECINKVKEDMRA